MGKDFPHSGAFRQPIRRAVKSFGLFMLLLLAMLLPPGHAGDRIIRVHYPPEQGRRLYVGGSGAGLTWNRREARPMSEVPPGSGNWELRLPVEERVTYKIVADRHFWQAGHDRVLEPGMSPPVEEPVFEVAESLTLGGLKFPFRPDLDGPRTLRVYVPPGYDPARTEPYPLMIALDGKEFFSPGSDAGTWAGERGIEYAIRSGAMEPTVVIAIEHGPDRFYEYASWREDIKEGGGIDEYGAWIEDKVLPFAKNYFNVDIRPEKITGVGSSLGASAWVQMTARRKKRPGPEDRGLIARTLYLLSGAQHWGGEQPVTDVKRMSADLPKMKIYMSTGDQEGDNHADRDQALRGNQNLRDALVARGYVLGTDLVYAEIPGGRHEKVDWSWALPVHLTSGMTADFEACFLEKLRQLRSR